MDHVQGKLLSDMEMDFGDPALINEWRMKSSHLSATQLTKDNNDWGSYTSAQKTSHKASSSASTNMISFGESNATPRASHHQQQHDGKPNFINIKTEAPAEMIPLGNTIDFSASPLLISESSIEEIYGGMDYCEPSKRNGGSGKRTSLQAKEHVLAERKRREKLTRQFIDLSSMIPGLQRLDKSSILGGAIKYIMEFEQEKKRIHEEYSAVSLKRTRLASNDDSSSSDQNFDRSLDSSPKIDVKISDENVIFVIDCKELKGIVDEISGEAKKLHLRVISSCSMEIGNGKLLITILSKMDEGFSLTAKDLANYIRMTILDLM